MPRKYTAQEMRELAECEDFAAYLYDDPKRCPDPDFAEDDITPMVKDMLRQAADMLGREVKYEYGVDYTNKTNGNVCSNHHHFDSLKQAKRYATPLPDEEVRFVRREVGEWEEAENV